MTIYEETEGSREIARMKLLIKGIDCIGGLVGDALEQGAVFSAEQVDAVFTCFTMSMMACTHEIELEMSQRQGA